MEKDNKEIKTKNKKCDSLNTGKIFVLKKDFIQPDNDYIFPQVTNCFKSHRELCIKIFEGLVSVTLFIILTLSGCTSNSENSSITRSVLNSNFTEPVALELTEIFKLDSNQTTYPIDIKTDNSNNLYLLEYHSPYIKIFDNSGNYINKYETILDSSTISSFNINNDTLFINYGKERKVLKYNINGSLIKTINFKNEIPNKLEFLSNDKVIGSFTNNLVRKDEMYLGVELKLVDNNFKKLKLISSFFGSYFYGNIDPEIPIFPFTVDTVDNKIYIGISSEKVYKIYCYDLNMNLQYIIDNKLPTVKVSEKEFEQRKKISEKFKIPPLKIKEKNFIESMFVDNNGLLWIRRAVDAEKFGLFVSLHDIFNSEGKYLGTVKMDNTPRMGNIKMNGDIIYNINTLTSEIIAYKYKLNFGSSKNEK